MATGKSPSLNLLLAASAALTGPAHAASVQQVGLRFNVYDEDAFSGASQGDPRRYRVRTQQLDLATRFGERDTLRVEATHEVMSGSSPWYVVPGADRQPIQVLSGATIRDFRSAVTATLTRDNGGNDTHSFNATYSQEQDYRAVALGAERSLPLTGALTLGLGASVSHDVLNPTDADLYARIAHAQKNTVSGFASASWVLDRTSVLETGVQLNHQAGFLSDPYKLVVVGSDLRHDTRPRRRSEAAWLLRYRLAVNPRAALHLDARVAGNSWGQQSLTMQARWYQSIGDGWHLIPGLRFYSQSQARFYAPFFDADPGLDYSSDYRLGAFGAISASLNLRKRIGHWEFSLGAERYHASTRFALGASDPDPALVSYSRAFAGVDYHFD
jgi:hypothetical protein